MSIKKSQQSLKSWTKQKWRTKSGKPSAKTGERYLPEKAIKSLTSAEYAATTRAKREGTRKGKQFVRQPKSIAKRLHDFAEAGNDPREVRLAEIEPDIEQRVYLIKKKLWELKNVDRTNITDSKSGRDMA